MADGITDARYAKLDLLELLTRGEARDQAGPLQLADRQMP